MEVQKKQNENIRQENEMKMKRMEEMKERLDNLRQRKQISFPKYEKELLNQYLEYKGNIRVFIRSRPILPIDFRAYDGTKESFEKLKNQTKIHNDKQIELELPSENGKSAQTHMFFFDHVFGANKNQKDIYNEV